MKSNTGLHKVPIRSASIICIQCSSKKRRCSNRGDSIIEAATAAALLLPILFIMMWVITEVSEYFVLKQQLAFVARQAAHEVANAYGKLGYTTMNSGGNSSGPANTGDANYLQIINAISVPGVINPNSRSQFQVNFRIPNSPGLSQAYVSATVTYKSGPGLPKFPWNPIQSGFLSFNIGAVEVNSTCCWPIPH